MNRPGTTGALCTPSGAVCSHRYAYSWDEVGRLSRARRWDGSALGLASSPLPVATPNADLSYAYDASDMRVRTTVTSEPGGEKHTLYVFPSLELRKTSYVGAEYTLNDQVETVYLMAGGERLAKVLASTQPGTVPLASGTSAPLVLLHMQDALGSVSSVVDKASGELVESRGYRPYGDEEHSLRTSRWQWLREDYGFTGKEADVEVGLTYFGKRYLVPQTGRWLSPDPLALHVPGKADLNLYAYVSGRVFTATDPFGLVPNEIIRPPTSAREVAKHMWNTVVSDAASLGKMVLQGALMMTAPVTMDPGVTLETYRNIEESANKAEESRKVETGPDPHGANELAARKLTIVLEAVATEGAGHVVQKLERSLVRGGLRAAEGAEVAGTAPKGDPGGGAKTAAKSEAGSANGAKPSGGALAQQRGADFEVSLRQKLGSGGSFKSGGREFDSSLGKRWMEAKSGNYWAAQTETKQGFAKFKADMGARAKIAADNGATLELHSNSPIPQHAKDWMDSKGISYFEHPDLAAGKK